MPETRYDYIVNRFLDRLFVRFVSEPGVIVDYAVRYAARIDDSLIPVVLCDGSHGQGHCHDLDWNGNKLRRVSSRHGPDLNAAMTEAIEDLTTNWERYREAFLRRRP